MYVVEWISEALRDLARMWVDADPRKRARITAAVALLDRLMRQAPLEQGESRDGADRIAFAAPLGISFEVDETRRRVTVLSVWHIASRG